MRASEQSADRAPNPWNGKPDLASRPGAIDTQSIALGLWTCASGVMEALRVLVVEDDALIAMLLAEVLVAMGHEVCATAATEADAVTAASRFKPDLMIVDASLGRGSGVSAVEQILLAGPVAHVFMSGEAARVRERRPDAVVLRKPFREPELVRAIDIALDAVAHPQV
jgi:CheY-like chemotaxis protein